MKRSVRDAPVEGRRVLVRADLNVPLDGGSIADDTRIRASLPTIELLRERGARVVLVSHLGRPEGRDPELSMAPVAERLGELLGAEVALAPAVVGDDVRELAEALGDGDVLLLENSRFEAGETKNDPELAAGLAALAELYVNDAFGAAHRAHATTEGVARELPAYAGLLLERELDELAKVTDDPKRPLVMVLGGSKVTDKIGVIERFLDSAQEILIGGAMCFSFFKAEGRDTGNSLVDDASVEAARELLPAAGRRRRDGAPAGGPRARARVRRGHRGHRPERDRRPRGLDGPRHRHQHRGQVREANRARRHDLLERPDGRVRASPVRDRHARRSPTRWPAPTATRSWAAGTPPRRWPSSSSTTTLTGSRPAGARPSS